MTQGVVRALVAGKRAQKASVDDSKILTYRQSEVLRGILDGLTSKEISLNLNSSESAVKSVIQELIRKAGIRTRSQLVRIAIERQSSDWLNAGSDQ